MFVLLIHVTRGGHNSHHWTPGRFKIVLMHGHTCESLLNTLGRAVEQLAGCLAKQAKSQQSRSKYMTVSKRVFPFSRQWHQVTPIAPPTGCGIRPVPNRNQFEMVQPYYSAKRAIMFWGTPTSPPPPLAARYPSSTMLLLSNCFLGRFEAVVA